MTGSRQGSFRGLLLSALVLTYSGLGFLTTPSRGATAGQSGWVGIRAPAQRAPRVARGDDAVVIPTVIATIAGLAVGVAFAKAVEVAGTASQERGTLSEGLKAQLSADAGMEDVEDDETTKQSELLESLKKAQGISEEEA
ncbi:unnamed protein product, partial [Effrenium voratum]